MIDYKTGKINTAAWFLDPIIDPQLPLYSLLLKPDAIGLAQVKKGSHDFRVVGDHSLPSDGLKVINIEKKIGCNTWKELTTHWESQLTRLAEDFKGGNPLVQPLQGESTCRNCQQASFCRISETIANNNTSTRDE